MVDNGKPDVMLRVHLAPLPSLDVGPPLFQCERWSLFRHQEHYLIRLIVSELLSVSDITYHYRLAVFNSSFEEGDLFVQRDETIPADRRASETALDPLQYPLGELMIINHLAQGHKGVILHALGIEDGGRGLLFCGVSGAGKSTMGNLWKGTGVTLLSDDRIIVRRNDRGYVMHGTPWHGDAHIASPGSAPLEKIFFLSSAPRNYVKKLSVSEAATRLIVRCFPPFYDHVGMSSALEFLAILAEEVPCYHLGFVPDSEVVDFVRGLL